jgi:hypothetical protein
VNCDLIVITVINQRVIKFIRLVGHISIPTQLTPIETLIKLKLIIVFLAKSYLFTMLSATCGFMIIILIVCLLSQKSKVAIPTLKSNFPTHIELIASIRYFL